MNRPDLILAEMLKSLNSIGCNGHEPIVDFHEILVVNLTALDACVKPVSYKQIADTLAETIEQANKI